MHVVGFPVNDPKCLPHRQRLPPAENSSTAANLTISSKVVVPDSPVPSQGALLQGSCPI